MEDESIFNNTDLESKKKKKMNPFNSMLPLFLLALFALFSPAKPDAALIRNLCGRTEQPVICSACLNSDSASRTANGRGLAVIAVGCAERNTRAMAQRIGDISRRTPNSPVKTLLNDCWFSTGYAAGNFPGIRSAVQGGDYARARNGVEISIRNVNSCLAGFDKNPSVSVPSEVLAGTVAAVQSCRIVLGILNNI